MAGAALRGMGIVLKKHLKKAPILGKYVRPSKALGARPSGIRGKTLADQARGVLPKGVKAPPSIKKVAKETGKGAIIAGVAYAAGKVKGKKEAEAKETKEKLKKSAEEHKKKTKEKRKKYGKHHG